MSIAPIIRTIRVNPAPARAFELFAAHMGDWWPGATVGKKQHVAVVIEPRKGGRWYERDADGTETQWGCVLAWEPPGRLLLNWQLNGSFAYDPDLVTELELTFALAEGGGTLVTLEHRNLERFGANAASHAERLRNGWPSKIDGFAKYANAA